MARTLWRRRCWVGFCRFRGTSRLAAKRIRIKRDFIYNKRVSTELIDKASLLGDSGEPPKPYRTLKPKTFLMILVMVICGPLGNVLLGKGMKRLGAMSIWPVSHLFLAAAAIFTSIPIWMGISSLLVFYIAYMLVLSWADYSFVQPASSVAYGVVALLGFLMLGESVSPLQWAGIAVICLGVFVVSRTTPRTTGPRTTNRETAGLG